MLRYLLIFLYILGEYTQLLLETDDQVLCNCGTTYRPPFLGAVSAGREEAAGSGRGRAEKRSSGTRECRDTGAQGSGNAGMWNRGVGRRNAGAQGRGTQGCGSAGKRGAKKRGAGMQKAGMPSTGKPEGRTVERRDAESRVAVAQGCGSQRSDGDRERLDPARRVVRSASDTGGSEYWHRISHPGKALSVLAARARPRGWRW